MTRKHKRIRNVTVLITLLVAAGLSIYGQKVMEIRGNVDKQIADQKAEIMEKDKELADLKQQYEKMDSEEYIRKIATEELGMVDQDTIVFQIKN